MPKNKEHMLHQVKVFRYLKPRELNKVAKVLEPVSFEKDHTVIRQGKTSYGMYIIAKGEALLSVRLPGDEEISISILKANDSFGEAILIGRSLSPVSIKTTGATDCFLLANEYFDMLRYGTPDLGFKINSAITEELCKHLHNVYQQIIDVQCYIIGHPQQALGAKLKESILHRKPQKLPSLGDNVAYIHRLDFFQSFSEREFEKVLQYLKPLKAVKGLRLIEKGEVSQSCFIVLRGAVQSTIEQKGIESIISVQGPGGIFGHLSFIEQGPSMVTTTVREGASLLELNTKALANLHKNDIALWYKTYDLICQYVIKELSFAHKQLIRVSSEAGSEIKF